MQDLDRKLRATGKTEEQLAAEQQRIFDEMRKQLEKSMAAQDGGATNYEGPATVQRDPDAKADEWGALESSVGGKATSLNLQAIAHSVSASPSEGSLKDKPSGDPSSTATATTQGEGSQVVGSQDVSQTEAIEGRTDEPEPGGAKPHHDLV